MNVFDVAKYLVEKLGKMTTMKLQKLTYYCQAWSLVWDEKPLFDEEFEAWANGPVCRELYGVHRHQFVIDNPEMFKKYLSGEKFEEEQIETMDAVIDYYGDKEPFWLSNLTHMEDPWKDARGNCKDGEACDTIISKESMQKYYLSL